jgi:hypothetical protein
LRTYNACASTVHPRAPLLSRSARSSKKPHNTRISPRQRDRLRLFTTCQRLCCTSLERLHPGAPPPTTTPVATLDFTAAADATAACAPPAGVSELAHLTTCTYAARKAAANMCVSRTSRAPSHQKSIADPNPATRAAAKDPAAAAEVPVIPQVLWHKATHHSIPRSLAPHSLLLPSMLLLLFVFLSLSTPPNPR